MTDTTGMEDWLKGKDFDDRSEAESYILNHDGKISRGMELALDNIYGEQSNLQLDNVAAFFGEVEAGNIPVTTESDGFAQRLFNRLRGLFG